MKWRLLVAMLTIPSALVAAQQVVRGTVTSGEGPVVGAQVSFVDRADTARQVRLVTRSDGRFSGVLPFRGDVVLRVRAIGYRSHQQSLDPAATANRDLELVLEPLEVRLADLEATAPRRDCRAQSEPPETLVRIFDMLRTTGEVITENLDTGRHRFAIEQTRLDVLFYSRTDSSFTLARSEGTLSAWPITSPPGDVLQKEGFARRRRGAEGSGWLFHGPDLAVLSSDWFLASHCFWVERSQAQADSVVLHFAPMNGGKLVDVEGTLEIDLSNGTLRRLEFRHVNLPSSFPRGRAGGSIHFALLEDGTWYPESWMIRGLVDRGRVQRIPVLGGTGSREPARLTIIGYVERRGRVVTVTPTVERGQ